MILWIVHRCHRQLYHRKNGLKCYAEFAQNSQKSCADFAVFWRIILTSLVVALGYKGVHITPAPKAYVGCPAVVEFSKTIFAAVESHGK